MAEPAASPARILVVDDEAPNRRLLHALLVPLGFQVVEAADGAAALAILAESNIDLVLLDVMMPGLSGLDVCRRVRADPRLAHLPVVFVTALADRASRIAGKAAGADDFLAKPVDDVELLVRVRNLLQVRAQSLRLVELDRFKDEMTALLAHDLRNVMAAITGNLLWALDQPGVSDDLAGALGDARDAGVRGSRLIADLLDVPRLEAGRLHPRREPRPLAALLSSLVGQRRVALSDRQITVDQALIETVAPVDVDLVTRVLDNLLDNALRYTPRGGRLHVGLTPSADTVRIDLGNTGPAIAPEVREHIFAKYAQATPGRGEGVRDHHGLGLYFCRLAIGAHAGRIWVESTPTWPAQFVIELPLAPG